MPGQYKQYKHTGTVMAVLRCLWATAYLWVMIHAAAVVPLLHDRWVNTFWNGRLKFLLAYTMVLPFDLGTEMLLSVLLHLVLFTLYRYSRCSFVGSRQVIRGPKVPLDYRVWLGFVPYLTVFCCAWLLTTSIVVAELFRVLRCSYTDNLRYIYCQLVIALLFKLLVLLNMVVISLRCWAILQLFDAEPDGDILNIYNFGEHLNVFFRI